MFSRSFVDACVQTALTFSTQFLTSDETALSHLTVRQFMNDRSPFAVKHAERQMFCNVFETLDQASYETFYRMGRQELYGRVLEPV